MGRMIIQTVRDVPWLSNSHLTGTRTRWAVGIEEKIRSDWCPLHQRHGIVFRTYGREGRWHWLCEVKGPRAASLCLLLLLLSQPQAVGATVEDAVTPIYRDPIVFVPPPPAVTQGKQGSCLLWTECVPFKFLCGSPKPQSDGIWMQGLWRVIKFRWGHEGGAPTMG